jgi:hypothetical protein
MKYMNLTYEDGEFEMLEKIRKEEFPKCNNWENFFVELAKRRKK